MNTPDETENDEVQRCDGSFASIFHIIPERLVMLFCAFMARRKLKKAGFVVRKTGGRLHALYRIGEERPVSLCNIYGVPIVQNVIMGAGAMSRAMPKKCPSSTN